MDGIRINEAGSGLVAALLILQVIFTFYLWTLAPLGALSQRRFGAFLAIDLLCFAMIAYIYSKNKSAEPSRRVWMLLGCAMILVLIFTGLFV